VSERRDDEGLAPAAAGPPTPEQRLVAIVEILLCSDFPTQIAIGRLLALFGYFPTDAHGALRLDYVALLSFADAALLIAIILGLLAAHREPARRLFFGRRSVAGEASLGVPLIFVALGIGAVTLVVIQRVAPTLHTVPHNPLQGLIRTRADALVFGAVVIVAGAVREEVQRAFILHRFEEYLGGAAVGVVVASAAFGAGHLVQGVDVAIATALLGALWAVVYLRRRSIVAPMVSHAGFNLLQVMQFLMLGH
jgi:membrane protease YdiL (CAAX protease family)